MHAKLHKPLLNTGGVWTRANPKDLVNMEIFTGVKVSQWLPLEHKFPTLFLENQQMCSRTMVLKVELGDPNGGMPILKLLPISYVRGQF